MKWKYTNLVPIDDIKPSLFYTPVQVVPRMLLGKLPVNISLEVLFLVNAFRENLVSVALLLGFEFQFFQISTFTLPSKIKSNATDTNYFTTFLQNANVVILLLVSSRPIINITFSFTNNHSPHQQFVNFFVKQFVSLALFRNQKVVKLLFVEGYYLFHKQSKQEKKGVCLPIGRWGGRG